MAQNKEQLNKLLQFIKRLIEEPGNEEFVSGLRNILGVPIQGAIDNVKISDIEHYLGLDYKLDKATPVIDYSFIKDNYIREQLSSDYREMLRYRYGVRSHKIDFSEFCRYAMLQVEELINYYYYNRFNSLEEIKEYINKQISWVKIGDVESMKSFSLSIKLSAFAKNIKKKSTDTLDFAREVRNEQSHRSPKDDKTCVLLFRDELQKMGLPLTKEGEVFWNGIKNNEVLLSKYNSIDRKTYWRYRYNLWILREPFDDILESIQEVVQQVKKELKDYK